ncbi:hypothetical protein ACVMGC_004091 [Bradyrhizobium barranii subsp. barranii]
MTGEDAGECHGRELRALAGVEDLKLSSVKNADQLERKAEIVWMKYSILQESGVLDFAFLRFWILLLDDS